MTEWLPVNMHPVDLVTDRPVFRF